MKKTFAQLKRDLQLGVKVKQVLNEVMGGITNGDVREIIIVQTNAIALKTKKDNKIVNSWLYFPDKASDVEYIGNTFTFNVYGKRIGFEIIKEKENE